MGPAQFDKRSWMKIELEMVAKFGKAYKVDKLKQKWHRLKSHTKIFQGLTEATGFGWDTATNTVTADDEVWETYIKVCCYFFVYTVLTCKCVFCVVAVNNCRYSGCFIYVGVACRMENWLGFGDILSSAE